MLSMYLWCRGNKVRTVNILFIHEFDLIHISTRIWHTTVESIQWSRHRFSIGYTNLSLLEYSYDLVFGCSRASDYTKILEAEGRRSTLNRFRIQIQN